MSDDKLEFKLGSIMQLESTLPENIIRLPVSIIGCYPEVSLIVTTPKVKGKVQLIREGNSFHVRMLFGDSVKAFTTNVLASTNTPYPHLHLKYPRHFESVHVRNGTRVNIDIPSVVLNVDSGQEKRVQLCDMSSTGASIIIKGDVFAEIGDVLQMVFELELLGNKERMNMNVFVRRIIEQKPEKGVVTSYFYGLQFDEVSRYQQLVMHGWLLEHSSD